jgi:hypothetical protein
MFYKRLVLVAKKKDLTLAVFEVSFELTHIQSHQKCPMDAHPSTDDEGILKGLENQLRAHQENQKKSICVCFSGSWNFQVGVSCGYGTNDIARHHYEC